jgi:hypothetical protein
MNAMTASAALVMLSAAASALAQNPLPIAADAIVHEREGSVVGCGVRLTGGQPSAREPSSWFDVSFNVFRRGIALAQAVAYEMPRSAAGESRPSRVAVQSAWIAAGTASAKLGENVERRESLVYSLALEDAVSLFDAAAQGTPLRLGLKTWGQRTATIHEGVASLNRDARDRIADCVGRLTD